VDFEEEIAPEPTRLELWAAELDYHGDPEDLILPTPPPMDYLSPKDAAVLASVNTDPEIVSDVFGREVDRHFDLTRRLGIEPTLREADIPETFDGHAEWSKAARIVASKNRELERQDRARRVREARAQKARE
jgi:hypothetical protein